MTKRNIARSSESVDAFERPSESPERGALMEERFPTNYSVLLAGPPGVGKFEYLIARIREDLRLGERVVFVTLDMPPNEIRPRAKTNLGFILYAVHEGVHEPMTMNLLRSLVDGVIEMRYTDTMEREIRVHHMRGYQVDAAWHPFRQLPETVVSL